VSASDLTELRRRLQAEDAAVRRTAVADLSAYLRGGDRALRCEAAKTLFEHFREPLRRHIRCELVRCRQASPGGAADAFHSRIETHVNSALLRLLERLEKGPLGDGAELRFLAYLKAIVRNALASRQRRGGRSGREPAERLEELPAREPPAVEHLADEEERRRDEIHLEDRRQHLPPEDQQVLELYRAGLTYREIAERLGGTPGQYRARMGRIIRKLR